mmetsp:Transcript_41909/g.82271  ORF Transcript_41909/g.82271 Transcript_41909/m.82271 type:complete len:662 (-) Transcript_41909:2133-4118(-)
MRSSLLENDFGAPPQGGAPERRARSKSTQRVRRFRMRTARMKFLKVMVHPVWVGLLRMVLSIDNVLILLSISSRVYKSFLTYILVANGIFHCLYSAELFFCFLGLGKYFYSSASLLLDTVVTATRFAILINLWFFIKLDFDAVEVNFCVLMVITAVKLMLRNGQRTYVQKILRIFEVGNYDFRKVCAQILNITGLSLSERRQVLELLMACVGDDQVVIRHSELFAFYMQLSSSCTERVVSCVTGALLCRTLSVKVVEAILPSEAALQTNRQSLPFDEKQQQQQQQPPVHCRLTLRNAINKKVSTMQDKINLARTKQVTKTREVDSRRNTVFFDQSLLFDAIPHDVRSIRLEVVRKNRVIYIATLPLAVLEGKDSVCEWFSLSPPKVALKELKKSSVKGSISDMVPDIDMLEQQTASTSGLVKCEIQYIPTTFQAGTDYLQRRGSTLQPEKGRGTEQQHGGEGGGVAAAEDDTNDNDGDDDSSMVATLADDHDDDDLFAGLGLSHSLRSQRRDTALSSAQTDTENPPYSSSSSLAPAAASAASAASAVDEETSLLFDPSASTLQSPAYGVGAVILSTFRHWKPLWKLLVFTAVVLTISGCISPANAWFFSRMIDYGLKPAQSDETWAEVIYCCSALAGVYVMNVGCNFLIGFFCQHCQCFSY